MGYLNLASDTNSIKQDSKEEHFFTLFYRPKRIDGHGWKGGGATVLADARNGEVLVVIRGEKVRPRGDFVCWICARSRQNLSIPLEPIDSIDSD